MVCILAHYSLAVFYMLMILHYWLLAAMAFSSWSTSVINTVCNGISDLIHRIASWLILAETRLVIISLLLCSSVQTKYFGCCFKGKQCAVDPSNFIGKFYGTFNNILNVMGNCWNEMSALYLIQTYCLPSLLYSSETWSLSQCDEKHVKSLMRIGTKVSNRCSIIALAFLYQSCYPWRNCYFGRKCYV